MVVVVVVVVLASYGGERTKQRSKLRAIRLLATSQRQRTYQSTMSMKSLCLLGLCVVVPVAWMAAVHHKASRVAAARIQIRGRDRSLVLMTFAPIFVSQAL